MNIRSRGAIKYGKKLYPSPRVNCGYDISNYLDVDEEFGGMEVFKGE